MADELLHTQLRHIRFLLFVLVGFTAAEVVGAFFAFLTLVVVVILFALER